VAEGRVEVIVRLGFDLVVEVVLLPGSETPERASNKSSPNRIVIRAVHWMKTFGCFVLLSLLGGNASV